MTPEQLDAFLADYRALCEKHQAVVWACGDCDSPWVVEAGPGTVTIEENIEHLRESSR